jgi:YVTN family beta-propeller protein
MDTNINKPMTRRDAVTQSATAAVGLAALASPLGAAAVAQTGGKTGREVAYVCNALDDTVSVIDVASRKVVDTIHMDWGVKKKVPRWPFSLGSVMVANSPMNATFMPDHKQLWVPNAKGGNIAIVDTATNKVLRKIETPMDPCDVKFTPDGRKAVATQIGPNYVDQGGVVIIDTATGAVSPLIVMGTQPEEVAVTPDGKRAYNVSKSMWVVDIEKAKFETEVYLPYRCYDVVASPDGKQVYTGATFGGDKMVVLDNGPGPLGVKVSRVFDCNEPCCMEFSPDGSVMYITSNSKSTLQVYDLFLKMIVMTMPLPPMPSVMSLTDDGKTMFLAHNIGDSITVIDTRTMTITGRIKCGDQPNSVIIGRV